MHSPWQKLKFFLQKKWEKIPDLDHTSEKVSNSKIILSKNFNFTEQRNLVRLPIYSSDMSGSEFLQFGFSRYVRIFLPLRFFVKSRVYGFFGGFGFKFRFGFTRSITKIQAIRRSSIEVIYFRLRF